MNSIEERFHDAADTDMPPSRLSADGVYAAAFRRRRRRAAAATAAGLVAALVVAVVGVDVLRSSGDNRTAENPKTVEKERPWLRDGAVASAVATDADHLYAVMSVCRPNESCSYRLVGSDDAGATWSVRQDNFGGRVTWEVFAPAVGVLYQVQSHANPNYVDTDPDSPKMLVQRLTSTDGGRTWNELQRVTTPVDAVPAGGWLECESAFDEPCRLFAYDPANARIAPLRNGPGFRVMRTGDVPAAVGFWLSGFEAGSEGVRHATTPDRGRTWTTRTDDDHFGPVSADGVTGYGIVVDSYPVKPTGPNPTVSPTESKKRIYRTGDGGRTWQRVVSDRPLPDGAPRVVQSYVAADGTHVVLMTPDPGSQYWPWPYDRYTSGDGGRTYRPGGVTGLGDVLTLNHLGDLVTTSVAGVYTAYDDEVVYHSTDGLRWTRSAVNPPR